MGSICRAEPAQVKLGCYLEDLRNFDYLGGVFRGDLYLWLDSPSSDQESLDSIDFVRSRPTWSSPIAKKDVNGRHYECRRYMLEVNHDWNMSMFPFDTQRLRIKVEDLERSAAKMNFVVDQGSTFAKNLIPAEWEILSKKIYVTTEDYDTNFGDPSDGKNTSKYSRVVIQIILARHALPLFFKMVAGAYAAFAGICLSFWLTSKVHTYVSGRVGLIVGCLFSTIINQRLVENVIGRSSYVTHIDLVHLVTLICCISAGVITLISSRLSANQQIARAALLDKSAFWIFLLLYVGFNVALVGYDCWRIGTLMD